MADESAVGESVTVGDSLPQKTARTVAWLRGIVPPMITPLRDRDELDLAGLERLIDHMRAGEVHGIFILGTSGEGPHLSYRLRRELIDRVCWQVNHRVPVLVGITDTSLVEAHAMAAHAANAGAAAVVSAPPYYFPETQEEIARFVEQLLEGLPLPLLLYNMPRMTKVQFAPETLRRLAQIEKIVGIKDSSGDANYFESLLPLKRQRPDWSILVGPEHLLPATLRMGGDGGVNGGANFAPRLLVSLFEAFTRGDLEAATRLEKKLLTLNRIYTLGRDASSPIKAMKCACSLLGLCGDRMTDPFEPFGEKERQGVRAALQEAGVTSPIQS
jgi:2-dehydro-3-deoxy-D-pentonate aldolase